MLALLERLLAALLWLPLALTKPIVRGLDRKQRRSGARRVRPPSAESRPKPPARPRGPSPEAIAAMRGAVTRILDADDMHRKTYRHLARFERKFGESGLMAIEKIPVADLRRALRDFEKLVRNWSDPDLADLRSRMAVTLADRSSAASVWIAANSVNSSFRAPGA